MIDYLKSVFVSSHSNNCEFAIFIEDQEAKLLKQEFPELEAAIKKSPEGCNYPYMVTGAAAILGTQGTYARLETKVKELKDRVNAMYAESYSNQGLYYLGLGEIGNISARATALETLYQDLRFRKIRGILKQ